MKMYNMHQEFAANQSATKFIGLIIGNQLWNGAQKCIVLIFFFASFE